MIRIPITPDIPLRDFLPLRSHADWYLRDMSRSDPDAKQLADRPSYLRPAPSMAVAATLSD